jgi:Protein of unknown function (DUF2631)
VTANDATACGGNVASSELQKRPTSAVDKHDEPSVEWGWHGGFPRGILAGGVFTAIALLLMLIGNHIGRTEDLWLIGIAVAVIIGLAIYVRRMRNSWRR